MRSFKQLTALVLALAMLCSFAIPAFAQDEARANQPLGGSGSVEHETPPANNTLLDLVGEVSHKFVEDTQERRDITVVTLAEGEKVRVRIVPKASLNGTGAIPLGISNITGNVGEHLSVRIVDSGGNVLEITAESATAQGSPVSLGYVDNEAGVAATIPLAITVTKAVKGFGRFSNPSALITDTVQLSGDYTNSADYAFAIYSKSNLNRPAELFDINDFAISTADVFQIQVFNRPNGETRGETVRIIPKKKGTATLTHKSTGCTLTVEITSDPVVNVYRDCTENQRAD